MASKNRRLSDTQKREKELANKRFAREELGELLRLFSSLGLTVCAGILGFFWLGILADGKLTEIGWNTRNLGRIIGLLFGLALSLYWAYLRIVKHLRRFGPDSTPSHDAQSDTQDGDGGNQK